jgi:hypothetical protein
MAVTPLLEGMMSEGVELELVQHFAPPLTTAQLGPLRGASWLLTAVAPLLAEIMSIGDGDAA